MTVSVRGGPLPAEQPPQNQAPNNPNTAAQDQQGSQSNEQGQNQGGSSLSTQQIDPADLLLENGEPVFPHSELAKLDEMINRPRWVVPVLAKGELEILLDASIQLCRAGLEMQHSCYVGI